MDKQRYHVYDTSDGIEIVDDEGVVWIPRTFEVVTDSQNSLGSEPVHRRRTRVIYHGENGYLQSIETGFWVVPKEEEHTNLGIKLFNERSGFLPLEGNDIDGEYVGSYFEKLQPDYIPAFRSF